MNSSPLAKLAVGTIAVSLLCAGIVCAIPQVACQAQAKVSSPASGLRVVNGARYYYKKGAPIKNAWRTVAKKRYYFGSDGKARTGLCAVGSKWYYFNKKGVMQKGSAKGLTQSRKVKAGKWTYFLNNNYQLEARKKGSTYYYNNGDAMTSADTKDYTTWLIAQGIAKKNTKPGDSRSTKRLKVFKWVMDGYYKMWRNFSQRPDWPAVYAMDHFKHRCGDCNSDGAAFTYLAAAVGDEAYVCLITTRSVNAAHAWCEIDGREYDPLFAQAKSFSKYYGGKASHPVVKIKIPYFSPSHVNNQGWVPGRVRGSKAKKGLVTTKAGNVYYYKNGKPVKSRWVTVKGKSYYFASDGKAVTGSKRVKVKNGSSKKAYFVFGDNRALKTGTKVRTVKVGGIAYRVSAKGRAMKGWADGKKNYFFADGHRAQGIVLLKGKLACFGPKGTYSKTRSAKLNRLAKRAKKAVASDMTAAELKQGAKVQTTATEKLLKQLGTRVSMLRQSSCLVDGAQDRLYQFEHVSVQTLKAGKTEVLYDMTKVS